jgi:nitrile hydratase beta subunit
MDGIHDLGGKQGFGAVEREVDELEFHSRWEAAVYTMVRRLRQAGAIANVDQFRHAVERIDPVAYLTHGYYGRWLGAVETLLLEQGLIEPGMLAGAVVARGGDPAEAVAARPDPAARPMPPASAPGAAREVAAAPRFEIGQRVRTAACGAVGHTRLPAYARGRIGTVSARHGGWVFPDTNAHGRGEEPQHLYCVGFDGAELWGADAEPGVSVYLDLFETYLEKAGD